MDDKEEKKDAKVVATPIKKPTAFEQERIAARQRLHEANVRAYLAGR